MQFQGYGAAFITDHNRVENTEKAKAISRADWRQTGYRSLEGEEVSLWKTHLVVLDNHERIDNRPFDTDASRIQVFIHEMNRRKIPVIASIPEYWFYHWNVGVSTGGTINDFVRWGINGFEIVNSAPKALDFPPAYRREIVELCRKNNLFMTGISDNHGYGYATAAWNAMRIPGWQAMDPDQLEIGGPVDPKSSKGLAQLKFWSARGTIRTTSSTCCAHPSLMQGSIGAHCCRWKLSPG